MTEDKFIQTLTVTVPDSCGITRPNASILLKKNSDKLVMTFYNSLSQNRGKIVVGTVIVSGDLTH